MTLVRRALDELDRAGVVYCVDHDAHRVDDPPHGDDVDVVVARSDLALADRTLRRAGLHHLRAPGHPGHRFYLGVEQDHWIKIDVIFGHAVGTPVGEILAGRVRVDRLWVASREAAYREKRNLLVRGIPSPAARILRRVPAGPGRRGPIVAFVGPDGSGKGTVIDALRAKIPIATTVVYFGWRARSRRRPPRMGRAGAWRETAFLLKRTAETWVRLARAWSWAWRGHVVLCDRYPTEVAAVATTRTRWAGAVERLLFVRLVPQPDAVVVLDAPAATLYARKGEHDPGTLARWRLAYGDVFTPQGAIVVGTDRPLADTVSDASRTVWRTLSGRRRWQPSTAKDGTRAAA